MLAVSTEVAALALTFAVHVFGAAVLIVNMFDRDEPLWRNWWPTDREDDGPPPPPPPPRRGPDGLPLPDADQSAQRLRGPGRIGPWRRGPRTRPDHAPREVPAREPDPR
jgi:hypothetical protein